MNITSYVPFINLSSQINVVKNTHIFHKKLKFNMMSDLFALFGNFLKC